MSVDEEVNQAVDKVFQEKEVLIQKGILPSNKPGVHPTALVWILSKRLPNRTREEITKSLFASPKFVVVGEKDQRQVIRKTEQ